MERNNVFRLREEVCVQDFFFVQINGSSSALDNWREPALQAENT